MRTADKLLLAVLLLGCGFSAMAAVEVGEVAYSRGVLTGQLDGELPRIIARGLPLHNGETLNTGSNSFAIIELKDGTRMTLRPETTFKIENVNQTAGSESALMSLIRGGLRAITGTISKRNPNVFRINTSVATIGIRGTEFDARLCEGNECQAEEDASGKTARRESRVVGRVALLRGTVTAREDGQRERSLSVGAAIYERDQIQTGAGSFTVIAFNDKTRVTLSPESAFRVEKHEFRPEEFGENNSFLRFLKGGMRIVTGLIGQLNPNAFRVGTPTATIGIRGTGFDLVCQGACTDQNALVDPARDTTIGKFLNLFLKPAYAQNVSNGMYAKAWRGTVLLYLGGDTVVLPTGRTVFMRDNASPPRLVADIPPLLRNFQGAPRPDSIEVPEGFFSEEEASTIKPGLYVKVDEGDVAVQGIDGNTVHLGSGEALHAGALGARRLGVVPAFQKFDRYPNPTRIDARLEQRMDLFGERGAEEEGLECTVQ